MIFDKLERAERYYYLSKYFQKAFEFISNNDLTAFEPGKYEIDGENAFMIIALDKPKADFVSKLEAHRKYIDIQISVEGSFGISWKALDDCQNLLAEYDSEKDAVLYSDQGDFEVVLNPGNFTILMPEDAHCPNPPLNSMKKAVLKILI